MRLLRGQWMKEIEFKEITKIYPPDVTALEDITVTIERGEFVFLTGRSGSGKSTFLKLLSGQLLPTSGEVWVRGHCTSSLTHEQLPHYRRMFGIMQADMGLLGDRTVRQNIELAMYATEQPAAVMRKRVKQAMNTVGIPSRAEHFPRELSGGETERALLARALVTDPKILVLDEPTANLDPSASWDLMCLIDEINRKGYTVVVASHDRELVSIMKKRVITFAAGAKVGDGKSAVYDARIGDIFAEREVILEREARKRLEKRCRET